MEEKASCSSSNPPDEISLFLHHFVLRSSASSSSSPPSNCAPASSSLAPQPFFHHLHIPPPPHASGDGIPSSGIDPSFAYATAAARASHAPSSSSVGASENEADEYDGESEEGLEALLEEVPTRPNTSRTSSKRSRTAEVHNLSEKRRRSRINEKMKALQSLIPNSNKTDKASMLDEAIEYLKQLQLQVQMLSMRNGLSLHPMCLPGPIQAHPQMRPLLGEEDNNEHLQHTLHQETPHSQTLFELLERRSEPSIPNIFTSDSPFGFNSSSQNHPAARPFHLHLNSEEICRDDAVRHQQLNINNHSESSLFDKHASYPLPKPELNVGAREALSLPFGSQPSITKTEDPFRGS